MINQLSKKEQSVQFEYSADSAQKSSHQSDDLIPDPAKTNENLAKEDGHQIDDQPKTSEVLRVSFTLCLPTIKKHLPKNSISV